MGRRGSLYETLAYVTSLSSLLAITLTDYEVYKFSWLLGYRVL